MPYGRFRPLHHLDEYTVLYFERTSNMHTESQKKNGSKTITVTGRGGLWGLCDVKDPTLSRQSARS
jgi:hypothetical protein